MCGATYTWIAVKPSQNAPYAVRKAAANVAPGREREESRDQLDDAAVEERPGQDHRAAHGVDRADRAQAKGEGTPRESGGADDQRVPGARRGHDGRSARLGYGRDGHGKHPSLDVVRRLIDRTFDTLKGARGRVNTFRT